ncbi:hypothetical protein J1605_001560 [Eschrichtius robustus]|uniref:Uncharacterized protein n=1 Tax=Eschrichtius robustus TaxID=9764 RepID=A0AB34I4W3_ESCRO|nr:hypothetical protein J1605_001560 [Eschrichtius robustus]
MVTSQARESRLRPSELLRAKKPLQPYLGHTTRPDSQGSAGVDRGPAPLGPGVLRWRQATRKRGPGRERPTHLREWKIAAGKLASGVRPPGYSGLAPVWGRVLAATFPATLRQSAANERSRSAYVINEVSREKEVLFPLPLNSGLRSSGFSGGAAAFLLRNLRPSFRVKDSLGSQGGALESPDVG